jgi:ABC-2 type transport system ATP-binding protein
MSRYHGAITLELADAANARQQLEALPGVKQVEVDSSGRRLTVFPQEGQSLFVAINALIQAQSWEVHELHVERGRLDEVFRSITLGAA